MTLEQAESFVGKKVQYRGYSGILKSVNATGNIIVAHCDNGIVCNIILLKNENGVYLDEIDFGDEQVSTLMLSQG